MTSALRYSRVVIFILPLFRDAILQKVYNTPDKRARTSLAKQVVDTLDDRKLSRDRIILQRIIDRGYSDGYFYFYFHGS